MDKMLVKTTLNKGTDEELFVALESMSPRLRASAIRAFASAWIRSGGVSGASGRKMFELASDTAPRRRGEPFDPVVETPDVESFKARVASGFSNF
jgi:hypothetical protein